MDARLHHEKVEDLKSKKKSRSKEADKCIAQLREEGVEILNSQLEGQTVVVWIWCRTQAALENCQKLHETNRLRATFFENILQSVSKVIHIDRSQFKKILGKFLLNYES